MSWANELLFTCAKVLVWVLLLAPLWVLLCMFIYCAWPNGELWGRTTAPKEPETPEPKAVPPMWSKRKAPTRVTCVDQPKETKPVEPMWKPRSK